MLTAAPDPKVFAALADSTRLALVQRLSARPAQSTTQLTQGLGMSRQAVRQHLGVLADAGLVAHRRAGRSRLWELDPAPLADVEQWAAAFRQTWEARLDRLDAYLTATEGEEDEPRQRD